jgi:hypothetical protein
LQEEVEQNRRILHKLRQKYTMATTELKDFREEAEEKRQVMQETLTEQEREIEFLGLVMKTLLKETELQNLRERARYDENN